VANARKVQFGLRGSFVVASRAEQTKLHTFIFIWWREILISLHPSISRATEGTSPHPLPIHHPQVFPKARHIGIHHHSSIDRVVQRGHIQYMGSVTTPVASPATPKKRKRDVLWGKENTHRMLPTGKLDNILDQQDTRYSSTYHPPLPYTDD
jgi:hypothetical protein